MAFEKKRYFRRSQLIMFFCYYSEKCKTNVFILLLLWLGMISTYMPHKFIKAFPPYVNYVVTLPVKFVRFYVILLLLIFPDKVIT